MEMEDDGKKMMNFRSEKSGLDFLDCKVCERKI